MHPVRSVATMGSSQTAKQTTGSFLTLRVDGETISARLTKADTMLSRMKGLLGRSSLGPNEGLWIIPCPSIHMFFMRFAIDAVFIDKQGVVVKVVTELAPWRMARGGRGAHSVLELPAGRAGFFDLKPGDQLEMG